MSRFTRISLNRLRISRNTVIKAMGYMDRSDGKSAKELAPVLLLGLFLSVESGTDKKGSVSY